MYETDIGEWECLPNGNIQTDPLVGFEVAAAPRLVLLRLEILTETGQIGYAQLRIPADQANELAQALQQKAATATTSDNRSPRR